MLSVSAKMQKLVECYSKQQTLQSTQTTKTFEMTMTYRITNQPTHHSFIEFSRETRDDAISAVTFFLDVRCEYCVVNSFSTASDSVKSRHITPNRQ